MTATALLAVVSAVPTAAKDKPVPVDYGPAPDWDRYRELGEQTVKQILIDPESARISWPNGYVQRGYTPPFSKRIHGYATCGRVNSRNRMGGYVGASPFAVVIDHDRVLYVEVGKAGGMMDEACAKANFPPPPSAIASRSGPQPAPSPYGFGVSAVPNGAYIAAVASGGAGERAGLRPGMVITRINGIAVKGLPVEAVTQMITGAEGQLSLEVIGGALIKVARP